MLNGMEIMIVAGVVVLLFGTNKLPKLGSAVGETIKNFKNSVKDAEAEEKEKQRLQGPRDDQNK